jgi:hypothetical protein
LSLRQEAQYRQLKQLERQLNKKLQEKRTELMLQMKDLKLLSEGKFNTGKGKINILNEPEWQKEKEMGTRP